MSLLNRRVTDQTPRRMRKGMYILPSLFTTANIAAGFYAISQSALAAAAGVDDAPALFNHAAIAIGFAVFFDGLDGAVARMTHTASDFGKELDSLADVITFGVAPAILAWLWGFRYLPLVLDRDLREKLVQFGAAMAFLFLVAGACRLARFNITLNPQPKNPGRPGRKYFVGMPIPGGAGCIAAVVHLRNGSPVQTWWTSIVWMVYLFCCGYLMVSTWRFWSSKSIDFGSRRSARWLVLLGLIVASIWFFSRYVLFAMAILYMFSGVLARLTYAFRRREPSPPQPREVSGIS